MSTGKNRWRGGWFFFFFLSFFKKVSRRNSPRQSSPLTPLINVILTCSFKNCLFAQSLVAVRNLQVHFPPSCFLPSFLFLFFLFVSFVRRCLTWLEIFPPPLPPPSSCSLFFFPLLFIYLSLSSFYLLFSLFNRGFSNRGKELKFRSFILLCSKRFLVKKISLFSD